MTNEEMLDELKALAAQMAIPVRFETGNFEGGLCIVNNERVPIVNRKAAVPKKIATIAVGLHQSGLENVYIKPAVRDAIEDEMARLRVLQLASRQPESTDTPR